MRRLLLVPFALLIVTACTNTSQPVVTDPDQQITLRWDFTADETSTEELPKTKVGLLITGKEQRRVEVGVYEGNGSDVTDGAWEVPQDAITSAVLWWAGGGYELAVRRQTQTQLVVDHRWLDEAAGQGEWKTINWIDIPAEAVVVPATE